MSNRLLRRIRGQDPSRSAPPAPYGLSRPLLSRQAHKHSLSARFSGRRHRRLLVRLVGDRPHLLDRLLRLRRRQTVERHRRQSSWRGLRLRQGLPVRGQRTHTNAHTAKRLNLSLYR